MQGGRYLEDEEFSKGTGPVQLSNVSCTGLEASVVNCTHSGIGVHNCSRDDDIGVMCNKSGTLFCFLNKSRVRDCIRFEIVLVTHVYYFT